MTKPSQRLRDLADAYDADEVTYGEDMALDCLISDLASVVDDLAAVAAERTE